MIRALMARLLGRPVLQPDAVPLATILAERERFRQERDAARVQCDEAEARARAAARRAQSEHDAAERYIAERDEARRGEAFWMREADGGNRLLAAFGQRHPSAVVDAGNDVVVLSEYRRTKADGVVLPFSGPII